MTKMSSCLVITNTSQIYGSALTGGILGNFLKVWQQAPAVWCASQSGTGRKGAVYDVVLKERLGESHLKEMFLSTLGAGQKVAPTKLPPALSPTTLSKGLKKTPSSSETSCMLLNTGEPLKIRGCNIFTLIRFLFPMVLLLLSFLNNHVLYKF